MHCDKIHVLCCAVLHVGHDGIRRIVPCLSLESAGYLPIRDDLLANGAVNNNACSYSSFVNCIRNAKKGSHGGCQRTAQSSLRYEL